MSDLPRVDVHRSAIGPQQAAVALKRKAAIFALIALIIFIMIAWFGVLGWGVIEAVRQVITFIKSIWTSYA
jgi:hypothetical protein